jgi:hypothetical protein
LNRQDAKSTKRKREDKKARGQDEGKKRKQGTSAFSAFFSFRLLVLLSSLPSLALLAPWRFISNFMSRGG